MRSVFSMQVRTFGRPQKDQSRRTECPTLRDVIRFPTPKVAVIGESWGMQPSRVREHLCLGTDRHHHLITCVSEVSSVHQ
jgi:hypothetical protein